jgi:hypothetical protein
MQSELLPALVRGQFRAAWRELAAVARDGTPGVLPDDRFIIVIIVIIIGFIIIFLIIVCYVDLFSLFCSLTHTSIVLTTMR